MTVRSSSGALWLGAAFTFLSPPALAAGDLTVISFGRADRAALLSAYIDPFATSTGVKVNSLSYDGQVTELTQMVNAGKPTWDVMQVESRTLRLGCEQGLFEKLDRSRIPATGSLIPGAITECGVGIFTWSQALVYSDQLNQAPRTWADFWNLKKYPGKRGLRHSAKYTLEIALLADGVAPNDVYRTLATEAGVRRAFHKLDQISKSTIWWEAAAQPSAILAAGWVSMTSGYTLWFDPEQDRNKHAKISWPLSLYDIDSWAITKGSPKRDEAYRFISFASQAEHQKAFSEQLSYGPTNRAAQDLLPSKLPADALQIDANFWIAHGDGLEKRFNDWAPAVCRQQIDEDDDDYFDQPICQDAQGNMRENHGSMAASKIGQPGNPKEVTRTINVTMNDNMRFSPEQIQVKQGETVRFVLQNAGKLRHELVLGEPDALRRHAAMMLAMPDMQHTGPNMASLAPGEHGHLVWRFTRAGSVAFACLQPGHLDAGMKGAVAVQ